MNTNTPYEKLSLRRLWPAVSGKLYPETRARMTHSLKEVREAAHAHTDGTHHDKLLSALEELETAVSEYYFLLEEVAAQRLNTSPYGSNPYVETTFKESTERLAQKSVQVRTTLQKVHTLARTCFVHAGIASQNKLVLARLNSAEQDLKYLLFVEQQYIRPLFVKNTGVE